MKADARRDLDRIFVEEGDLIAEAIRKGARDAIFRHKQAGLPVVVYRDAKIMWIDPSELDV
jgi:hypothetical protein